MPREDTNGFVRCYACEEKHQQSKYNCNKCVISFSTKRERTEPVSSTLKFLDLFCCCGGISKGVSNVYPDADITGIDITDGHNYPFNFIQSDVFKLPLSFFEKFDLIHASPPCQHYSFSINTQRRQMYPDLVEKTRNLLKKTGKKFTIENIPGSPVRPDLILCGEYFNIRVIRHRVFEINGFTFKQPEHKKHKRPIDTTHSYYMQVGKFRKFQNR